MKALIGMSGGVDSSVAALLMLEAGYDCIGATMRLYSGQTASSGSGKTCMINLLGALDLPTQGQIGYENQLLSGKSERWRDHLRKTAYGFIFQSVASCYDSPLTAS